MWILKVKACIGSTDPSWSSKWDSWGILAFYLDHWLNVNYLGARWADRMAQRLHRCLFYFQVADLVLERSLISRAGDKHSKHRTCPSLELASEHKDRELTVWLASQILSGRALASHIGIFSQLVCYSSSACEFFSWLCLKGLIARCSTFLNFENFWSPLNSGSVLTRPVNWCWKFRLSALRRSLQHPLLHPYSIYFHVQACHILRLTSGGYLGID